MVKKTILRVKVEFDFCIININFPDFLLKFYIFLMINNNLAV